MNIYPLNSSVIESVVDFIDDEVTAQIGIQVRFKNGNVYSVPDATKELLQNFLSAKSAGAFFNEIIKPNFKIEMVTEEWMNCGIAIENISTGDRLEQNPRTGHIRRMVFKPLK